MKREDSNLVEHDQPEPSSSQMILDNFLHQYQDEPEWWDVTPSTEEAVALRKLPLEVHWPPGDIPFSTRETPHSKQVLEMYTTSTKYRQHCPDEDNNNLCPKPTETVLKGDKANKKLPCKEEAGEARGQDA